MYPVLDTDTFYMYPDTDANTLEFNENVSGYWFGNNKSCSILILSGYGYFFAQLCSSICARLYVDDELHLTIPGGHLIDDRDPSNCFTGFYDFGAPWNDANPWTEDKTCDHFMAPFDQDVSIVFLGVITMYQAHLVLIAVLPILPLFI